MSCCALFSIISCDGLWKLLLHHASSWCPAYDNPTAKAHKLDLENPAPIIHDEDEETLAAIDDGIRDAEAGRVVPAEKARELLPK
jgi:hypothetical protein